MRKHIARAKAATVRKTRKALETYVHFAIWADVIGGVLGVALLFGGDTVHGSYALLFVTVTMALAVGAARMAQKLAPKRRTARRSSK